MIHGLPVMNTDNKYIGLDKAIRINLQIKPYDIDAAGHVNNAVYINWFEDLRTKLIHECFNLEKLMGYKIYPVVVSTEIFYKKVLHLFDKPSGTMSVDSYKHGVLVLKAEIKSSGKIAAYGKQKCVFYDLESSKMLNNQKLNQVMNDNIQLNVIKLKKEN